MRLLVNTHILLWSLLDPDLLSQRVASELKNPSNEIWVSPISLWEILVLAEKGRVVLQPDPVTWVRHMLRIVPLREAPVNHEVAIQSRAIALPHEDPADRFLAATAIVYDLTLVTADERLIACEEISTLGNK